MEYVLCDNINIYSQLKGICCRKGLESTVVFTKKYTYELLFRPVSYCLLQLKMPLVDIHVVK